MCTHLQRRGTRYFLRRRIPQDLQVRYGKREITRALDTSDRRTAVVLCRRLELELDNEFRTARAQKPAQAPQQVIAPAPPPETMKPPEAIEATVDATTLDDLADK